MIDTNEMSEILEILENLEDEELAVELLKEFNQLKARQGKLILNLDKTIDHIEWKKQCDQIQNDIDKLVLKIKSL
jgi:hypothetical protein